MSDVLLTAVGLLEKLHAEKSGLLQWYADHNGSDPWREFADGSDVIDQAVATTAFDFRQIENATVRGKLALLDEAIVRIEADASQFDACQNPHCLGDGKIEHERLAILPWAKFCCACAAAHQRR